MQRTKLQPGRTISDAAIHTAVAHAVAKHRKAEKKHIDVHFAGQVIAYKVLLAPWWDPKKKSFFACVETNGGKKLVKVTGVVEKGGRIARKGEVKWEFVSTGRSYRAALPKGCQS